MKKKKKKTHGNRAAERKFGIDRKRIREWGTNEEEIISTDGKGGLHNGGECQGRGI